jgi:hypothetical protein
MRRLRGWLVAWPLVAGATPMAAQRAANQPIVRLEEPRPAPILPAVYVPFVIPQDWCQGPGGAPRVTIRLHNLLQEPLRNLRLRGRDGRELDRLALRCGAHVAFWDGAVGDPPHLPIPTVYYIRLLVERDGRRPGTDAKRVVVPQY